MGADIVKTTGIKIGDVSEKRISIPTAIERIAMVVDANAVANVKACKETTNLKECLHGKEGEGGMIADVEVNTAGIKINRKLLLTFIGFTITLLVAVIGVVTAIKG